MLCMGNVGLTKIILSLSHRGVIWAHQSFTTGCLASSCLSSLCLFSLQFLICVVRKVISMVYCILEFVNIHEKEEVGAWGVVQSSTFCTWTENCGFHLPQLDRKWLSLLSSCHLIEVAACNRSRDLINLPSGQNSPSWSLSDLSALTDPRGGRFS